MEKLLRSMPEFVTTAFCFFFFFFFFKPTVVTAELILFGWLLLIYSFQFRSLFQPQLAIRAVAEPLVSFCNGELRPMTLTFEFDLNIVTMNQYAKYIKDPFVQRLLSGHTPDRLLYLDH